MPNPFTNLFAQRPSSAANPSAPLSGFRFQPLTQGNSPFGTVGMDFGAGFTPPTLFKSSSGAPDGGPVPVRSPFSPVGRLDTTGLTVGDLLPSLPPDVVRMQGAAMDQPVAISPQLVEQALASGVPAVPLFEIYRVCPALFQVPVSPHDPRTVALPVQRIASMLQGSVPDPASPFGAMGGAAPDFGRPTSLPPKRPAGAPPSIPTAADFAPPGVAQVPSLQLPSLQSQAMPMHMASPFSNMEPAPAPQPVASPSPFAFSKPSTVSPLPGLASLLPGAGAPQPMPSGPLGGFTLPPVNLPQPPQPPETPGVAAGANEFVPLFTKPAAPSPSVAFPAAAAAAPAARPQAPQPSGGPSGMTPPRSSGLPALPLSQANASEVMSLPLQRILSAQHPEQLGFDASFIPAWVTVQLPTNLVQAQLSGGAVRLDLGTIIDHTEESFRAAIAHGRRNHVVELTMNDIFHALPPVNKQPPASPAPVQQQAPIQPQAQQQAPIQQQAPQFGGLMGFSGFPLNAPLQQEVAPTAPEPQARPQPQFSAFDPFAPTVGSNSWSPGIAEQSVAPTSSPAGLGSEQLFGNLFQSAAAEPVQPAPRPVEPTFAFAMPALQEPTPPVQQQPMAPAPQTSPIQPAAPVQHSPFITQQQPMAPAPQTSPIQPAAPVQHSPFITQQQPFSAAEIPAAPAAQPRSGLLFSHTATANPEQMLLRALFGVADSLDPERVVRLTAELPGVEACICVQNNKAITHGSGIPAAHDFQQQAVDLARGVQSLSSVVGIDGAETFSVQSKDRLVTFSLLEGMVFGVLHSSKEPVSGLRDKITLIARELAQLMQRRRS
jgi:hypothetical protein